MYTDKLDQIANDMKSFGDFLVPFNFPRSPAETEEDINVLKTREETIDGYSLILHYSKSEYEDHYSASLQVLGKYTPFLPFYLVCKIGKAFFGDKNLALVEFYKQQKKIYCWTVYMDKDNTITDPPHKDEFEHCVYEGFEYDSVNPGQVNFY